MNGEFAEKDVKLNVSENNLKVFLQYEIYETSNSFTTFKWVNSRSDLLLWILALRG